MMLYSKFLPGFPKFEEEAKRFQEELEENGITDADFSVFYTAGKIAHKFGSYNVWQKKLTVFGDI